MNTTIEFIEKYGVLPVINITDPEKAVPIAKALCRGGLPLIEVTLRSESSLESIRRIKDAYPDMIVGAGTVLSSESVDMALNAGADYIVSPGYDSELVQYCSKRSIVIIPGCSTASEIQDAHKNNLKVIKYFPAELSGGVEAIKLLSGPFPEMRFLPTGGIKFSNLEEYLSNDRIIACGGSFMATAEQIKNNDFCGIEESCRRAISLSLGFQLAHIGINHENKDNALMTAKVLASIFGASTRECSSSYFAGDFAECMNKPGYGKNGHVGISTHSIVRAMSYLSEKGIAFDESSIKRDAKGNITCIYFKNEIGDFAWHIVKK